MGSPPTSGTSSSAPTTARTSGCTRTASSQDTTADTSSAAWETGGYIRIGDGSVAADLDSWFYGTVDEAAVWTRALTQAEIDAIYTAGVEGAGAGEQVLLSDGAGGTYWGQVPTAALEDEAVTTLKIADDTIMDADVATGADIDPLKLEHPGGTTTFLRADGTWATPPGGGSSAVRHGRLDAPDDRRLLGARACLGRRRQPDPDLHSDLGRR